MGIIKSGLCLFQRVGSNYGIIDLDDGVIDWVTKDDLISFANKCPITGVDLVNKVIKPLSCILDCTKCNWNKDGSNIFDNFSAVRINYKTKQGTLITKTGKSIKFKLVGEYVYKFNFVCYGNIIVILSHDVISNLIDKWDAPKEALAKVFDDI